MIYLVQSMICLIFGRVYLVFWNGWLYPVFPKEVASSLHRQSASTEFEGEAVAKVVVKCVDHVLYLLLLIRRCFWNGWLYPLGKLLTPHSSRSGHQAGLRDSSALRALAAKGVYDFSIKKSGSQTGIIAMMLLLAPPSSCSPTVQGSSPVPRVR